MIIKFTIFQSGKIQKGNSLMNVQAGDVTSGFSPRLMQMPCDSLC